MNEQDKQPVDVSWLISQIGEALKEANVVADQIARGTGGREVRSASPSFRRPDTGQ